MALWRGVFENISLTFLRRNEGRFEGALSKKSQKNKAVINTT